MPLDNGEGRCDNSNCPKPKIWWNESVRHIKTGRKIPLEEPFNPMTGPPKPHTCMKKHKPPEFLNGYPDTNNEPPKDWHKGTLFQRLPKWRQKSINKQLKKKKEKKVHVLAEDQQTL